jgi:hypothetical protein
LLIVFPLNGSTPLSMTYRITPMLNMSIFCPYD